MAKKKTRTSVKAKSPSKRISKNKVQTKKKSISRKKDGDKPNYNMIIAVGLIVIAVVVALMLRESKITTESDKVVAVINGEKLYESDLIAEAAALPAELRTSMDNNTILSQLIDKNLLLTEANNAGVTADDYIQSILDINNITMEELEENIIAQGSTMDEFKENLVTFLFINQTVFKGIEVTDQEIAIYYMNNPDLFVIPETVSARHILISTEERSAEEAMTIMNEVQAKLDADPESFCDLVTEYSEDPGSVDSCGEYPPFTMADPYVQEYKDAAFSNEIGEYSIVQTKFGYHLVQTLDKVPETTLELDQVEEQLRNNILFEKQKEAFTVYMSELKNNSEIINCLETPEEEICGGNENTETEETETEAELSGPNIESLAKCLTEKGVKMYGAYWCSHCNAQKEMFEDSWQYIDYVECDEGGNEQASACQEADIQGYPTWEINGQQYPGEQTFERLASLSGCPF